MIIENSFFCLDGALERLQQQQHRIALDIFSQAYVFLDWFYDQKLSEESLSRIDLLFVVRPAEENVPTGSEGNRKLKLNGAE